MWNKNRNDRKWDEEGRRRAEKEGVLIPSVHVVNTQKVLCRDQEIALNIFKKHKGKLKELN